MRYFLLAVGMLVVGFLAGSWESKGTALRAQAAARRLEKRLASAEADCRKRSMAREMTEQFFRAAQKRPSPPPLPEEPLPASSPSQATRKTPPSAAPPSHAEMMEAAALAWQTRRTQAKQALIEEAHLSTEEAAEFEEIVSSMNERLREEIGEITEELSERLEEEGADLAPRETLRWADRFLETLIETDDALLELVPEEERTGITAENIDPTTYVDPTIFEPVVKLLDAVEEGEE